MFKFRCRMADFSENFRGPKGTHPCPLYKVHFDNLETSFLCPKIRENVLISEDYSRIYEDDILTDIFKVLQNIEDVRKTLMKK